MNKHRLDEKIIQWKSVAFRPRGTSKIKWEGDVKEDLKTMKFYLWKK
jgi:hypothetical protein